MLLILDQVALVVKNSPATAGDARDVRPIPGSARSPRGRHGNPLQYSRLKKPLDWPATVHRVAKSETWLKRLSTQARVHPWSNTFLTQYLRGCQVSGKKINYNRCKNTKHQKSTGYTKCIMCLVHRQGNPQIWQNAKREKKPSNLAISKFIFSRKCNVLLLNLVSFYKIKIK